MNSDPIPVYCDLLDPDRSSEFAVPLKFLEDLAHHRSIIVSTFARLENGRALDDWIAQRGLGDRLRYLLRPFRYSAIDGPHATKLRLLIDVLIAQRDFFRRMQDQPIVAKIGMVHFLFNFLPLLVRRKPMVMGPVSGFELFPLSMAWPFLSWRDRCYYSAFNGMTALLRMAFRLLARFRPETILICATPGDRDYVVGGRSSMAVRTLVTSEVAMPLMQSPDSGARRDILWSGAMIARKAPMLALDAIAAVLCDYPETRAVMLGEGPLLGAVRQRHAALPDDVRSRISLPGGVPLEQSQRRIGAAAVLLVTSWREVNSFVVYEALAHGVPIVSMPVSGMRNTVGRFGLLALAGKDRIGMLSRAMAKILSDQASYRARADSGIAILQREDRENLDRAWQMAGIAA